LLIRKNSLGSPYNRILDAAVGLMSADTASMQVFNPKPASSWPDFFLSPFPSVNGFVSIPTEERSGDQDFAGALPRAPCAVERRPNRGI
jgi:hypothetical protein